MKANSRFIKNEINNIILDTKTNLEWLVKDEKDITWDEANELVDSLGDNWRLPTLKELKSLYDTSKKGNIDPIFNLSDLIFSIEYFWVWSGELYNSDSLCAWVFYFDDGYEDWNDRDDGSGVDRVLAVRERHNNTKEFKMKQITDTDEIWQYFLDWYCKQFTVEDRATILGLRQDNWIAYKAGWLEGVNSHKKEINFEKG